MSTPAFSDEDLFAQFVACLQRNKLASPREVSNEADLKAFLALFAIEKMHLSRLSLGEGKVALLQAGISQDAFKFTLEVRANHDIDTRTVGIVTWVSSVFTTGLDPEVWCDRDLLTDYPSATTWTVPLEIGSSGRLQMLQ